MHPATPEHQQIERAVIVHIAMDKIQPAKLRIQAPVFRDVFESALAVIAKCPQALARIAGGADQVQQTVTVEIVHDGSAGKVYNRHPEGWCAVEPQR